MRYIIFSLLLSSVVFGADQCNSFRVEKNAVTFACAGGAAARVEMITEGVVRVRESGKGEFGAPLTVRFGFVKDEWPAVKMAVREVGAMVVVETGEVRVEVTKSPFGVTMKERDGRVVARGSGMVFEMGADEHFYGLGFQRNAFDLRGKKMQWWRAFRSNEATVPFFLSTRGYGFYSNNTYRHVFDFSGAGTFSVTADGGDVDYYLMHGPGFSRVLERYTALTGRAWMAPRWALGVGYQSRYLDEQHEVIANAEGFRREDLPLDWMGLEPGWEDVPYRMKWNWSGKRFPAPEAMIGKLAGMGIKMGLWESGDAPKEGFTEEAVRKAWYAPRIEAAIRKGIKFFKQDDPYPRMISSQEWLPPQMNSALGGSGRFTAEELNNLSNSLYSETAMKEYRRVTGERTMIMFNGYNSSIASHRWPFTWEADFPLGVGALNASLSGHVLVSTRDRNEAPDGIHLGYLAPFCYLESWAYYKEPWLYSEPLLEMNRLYAKLRYRLMPYLYGAMREGSERGMPLMRPMVLEFQGDAEARAVTSQFLLGGSLLVAAARPGAASGAEQARPGDAPVVAKSARVYLPKGRWYDFWSGGVVESAGAWRETGWPKTVGGPLFVRGGAVIPMGPVVAFEGQEPLTVVRLDVYPAGASKGMVYEDDGRTYEYEKGAFAKTEVRCAEVGDVVTVTAGARRGAFAGMEARRGYLWSVHTGRAPKAVSAAQARLAEVAAVSELVSGWKAGWSYDEATGTVWVKASSEWRYGADGRGAADVEKDTAEWREGARGSAGGEVVRIVLGAPAVKKAADEGLEVEHAVLVADGESESAVTVRTRAARVRVELDGAATLGCGARVCELAVVDGVARTTVRAGSSVGTVRVRAAGQERAVEIVRGRIVLKASPPARIKLNSDGSWLPLRANIYATVYAGGVRVKGATTRLRLHVEGGSGKVPADVETLAVEGVGTFANIVFEKPPNYVVVVSGAGVETARIPIY